MYDVSQQSKIAMKSMNKMKQEQQFKQKETNSKQ